MAIERLSGVSRVENPSGDVVAMVGSFAPIHDGHFDAVRSACMALARNGHDLDSIVLAPNSTEYVYRKLGDDYGGWTFERRILEILSRDINYKAPVYVDDWSGRVAGLDHINDYVPKSINRSLGIAACQVNLVVGSDQLLSLEYHLADKENRAICVLRPGRPGLTDSQFKTSWVLDALDSGRLIVTERENMEVDVSSTDIRISSIAG
jgi:nicotinic acid mononucleotide adenylyltransferase